MSFDAGQWLLLAASVGTILSALVVTFHPNILYASLALLGTFFGVAVLFLFAGADFLAGAQVIVYIGGVTILILFALMLTQANYGEEVRPESRRKFWRGAGIFLALAVPASLYFADHLSDAIPQVTPERAAEFSLTPKTSVIGEALLGAYLLPFEAITVLLLGALIGAVWIARPR